MSDSNHRAWLLAGLLACAPGAAIAATFGLPAGQPVATITIPDSWQTVTDAKFIMATPSSKDVHVSFELVSRANFAQAIKQWEAKLVDLKIKRNEASKTVQKFKFEGADSLTLVWKATDENGLTRLVHTILMLGKDHLLFVTKRGPQAEHKKSQAKSRQSSKT